MISPAINKADRLSSCASDLRRNTSWRRSKRHRIEVMLKDKAISMKDGKFARFNVNGIEIDAPAFKKLMTELVMYKVRLHSRSGGVHYYFIGRFLDRQGSAHWIVVRQAQVREWVDGGVLESQANDVQHFYEVITDEVLISRVKAKISNKREQSGEPESPLH